MYQAKFCKKLTLYIIAILFSLNFNIRSAQAVEVIVMAIFGEVVILEIDGTRHKLKIGDKTPQGISLVEIDDDTVVLKKDNKVSRHKLGGHVSFGGLGDRTSKNKKNATAKIWPQNDMYITHGSINKLSVQFLVDTGATWVAMSESVAKRLGLNYYRGTPGYAGTASGVAAIYKINLDSVQVGDIVLRNVSAAVITGYNSPQVLLGNSFLKRVEIQRTKQVMILKKKY
ncbi:retroviral-like aspartic protease family protein [Beggiatoa alba]|nr:retroviral-like aspartic protease family protein [Beggiatoa alba]